MGTIEFGNRMLAPNNFNIFLLISCMKGSNWWVM